jgi:hypothetical protein
MKFLAFRGLKLDGEDEFEKSEEEEKKEFE